MYGIVTNFNSIGIEICSTNKTGKITYANDSNFYFTEDTLNLAIELTKYLMNKYSIDIDHVVRHYDVTGKLCPGIIGWNLDSGDESRWFAFKQRLINQEEDEDMTQDKFNELMNNYIEQLANSDATWETNEMNWAQQNGLINGDNLGRTMPKKYLTRGELAAVLMRFKDKFIG
jgi:N-acetylmuramoyl-L-alanine amidase CwlA